jgi:hypothetical protein
VLAGTNVVDLMGKRSQFLRQAAILATHLCPVPDLGSCDLGICQAGFEYR